MSLLLVGLLCFSGLINHISAITISFINYTRVNYTNPPIDDINLNEISGLVWSRNDSNIFYGISDDLVDNKGWIKFEYNNNNYEMTPITGTILGDTPFGNPTNIDSESIAFVGFQFYNDSFGDIEYQYLVISSEGHRTYDTYDHIMLYDLDGTYIKDFSYPSLFNITDTTGTQNNGGFEALDISTDYTTIAYANERPLEQDDCNCSRIVIGTFDSSTARDPFDVTLTNEYILRYDTEGDGWWITDLILLDPTKFTGDNAPVMPALILEGKRQAAPADYDIFLVDLDLGNNDNVMDCFALESDCPESVAIDKVSVLDISGMEFPIGLDNYINYINLESMALYQDSDNTDDCVDTLILVNDNGGNIDTFWATFEIDYCNTYTDTDVNTNSNITSTITSDDGDDDDDDDSGSNGLIMINYIFISCVCVLFAGLFE